jgi:hypothetical protein
MALEQFNAARLQAPEEWRALQLDQFASPYAAPLPDGLVPFYGTPAFRQFSPEERQRLGREFIRFNAEALIVLEQALLLGLRKHRKTRPEPEKTACSKLAWEEYFHTRAFRQFLWREEREGFRKKSVLLFRAPRTRRWLASLAGAYPTALCLPGAKIEAYSLAYSKHVREAFGSWDANRWSKIQHLHLLDEAHHVAAQFELHSLAFPRGLRRIGLALAMLGFILNLQVLLMTGNWHLVKNALPSRSFFARILLCVQLAHWCVRTFPAYAEGRARMRTLLRAPNLPFGRLFAFMAW